MSKKRAKLWSGVTQIMTNDWPLWLKEGMILLLPVTLSEFFHVDTLSCKFVLKWSLKVLSHLQYVAALPCVIFVICLTYIFHWPMAWFIASSCSLIERLCSQSSLCTTTCFVWCWRWMTWVCCWLNVVCVSTELFCTAGRWSLVRLGLSSRHCLQPAHCVVSVCQSSDTWQLWPRPRSCTA